MGVSSKYRCKLILAENWKLSPAPPCIQTNFDKKWSSSDAGKLSIFSFFIPLASM